MLTKLMVNLIQGGFLSSDIAVKFEDTPDKELMDFINNELELKTEFLAEVLEREYKIPFCDLSQDCVDETAIRLLSYEAVTKYNVLPVSMAESELILAMSNPMDYVAIDDIYMITGLPVTQYFSPQKDITLMLNKHYSKSEINTITSQFLETEELKKNDSLDSEGEIFKEIQNAPAVKLADSLINSALLMGASDIHIEPSQFYVRVRYRIDGELIEMQKFDSALHASVVSRLKIMGHMNISEKRFPQDGYSRIELGDIHAKLRLSTIPTIKGEKVVIRLVYNGLQELLKEKLGFFDDDMENISRIFNSPYGAILVTGPTGSGKTTTLASFIRELNSEKVNIITIEDPVENEILGITQINVNQGIGIDFAKILRNVLRQDPDIIMIGEIRDLETAQIAIRSALTGHLVLSTLHTNDAPSTVTRLVDMGIESFLVAEALKGIISQRLVRKLCEFCKIEVEASDEEARMLRVESSVKIYDKNGCHRCRNTGYHGRFAIYEYVIMDSELRKLIKKGMSTSEIKAYLRKIGVRTIKENVRINVLKGNTTISEMNKAVGF